MRSIKLLSIIVPIARLGFSTSVFAQPAAELPDPNSIAVPDVGSSDPKVVEEGYKFFYFYNPLVSFEEAYADIAECRSFLASGRPRTLPAFVPWVEPQHRPVATNSVNPYGIVGSIMGSIILPKLERGIRNNKLRRCMEPRGYSRYPVPEKSWKQLNEGEEPNLIAMQAKLATGPKPSTPQVKERGEGE